MENNSDYSDPPTSLPVERLTALPVIPMFVPKITPTKRGEISMDMSRSFNYFRKPV